ncbi:sulfotransferase [Ktedonosporobacter rubrisoli]|uniref:Sulfotransferase n=1 Tax=Ktedonosporobacter rubrisoli TaxID=2509675 RepID=A0A4P6K1P0_KTERU|nr:sulfotransferase domain-containing protein [Ktedonosporobacter rubrisoli]QBD81743.1 sulfotransferase [Ktedonosporobacter rubrisoli]
MVSPFLNTARQTVSLYRNLTSSLRLMPDFLIIGTQKGGTTSLYSYLIEHPNIISARMKEVHFFDQHFRKGPAWYQGHFPTRVHKSYVERMRKEVFITGEGSPEYLFYPHPAQKVAALLPNVKLIALLRNPVDRAYSQYRHNIRWGHETFSFEDALNLEEERTREGRARVQIDPNYHSFSYQRAAYLARGIYAEQLERWLNLFPRERMLIIRSEDFYRDSSAIYKEVLAFLGVSVFEPRSLQLGYKAYNKSKDSDAPAKMDPALRKRLVAYFEPHNQRLYKLLGRNFAWDH